MSNFEFLQIQTEYALFAVAAAEAERVLSASPALCAVGCRKALELSVKWVYAADNAMQMPYKDNLQALVHEPTFRFAVDSGTWSKLPFIIKLGNLAVHTERAVEYGDALLSLKSLFEFILWIDYCYGENYKERRFDESLIPGVKIYREREFQSEDVSEFQTRKKYVDVDLKLMGWRFKGAGADVFEEFEVGDMAGVPGQKGIADYVLFGRDGLPLAVVEAKKTSRDPNDGRRQAFLYADSLESKYGRRPMMFTTNGFETYFWDDKTSPPRNVSGVFSMDNLQKLMNRRVERKNLNNIPINEKISGRVYQMAAIRAVCDSITNGVRKHLLVMATGTGKTRTAAGLVDVLSRGGYITNILFLADRKALVNQARDAFRNYLPDMSLCNLLSNKDDRNARIVFSTLYE